MSGSKAEESALSSARSRFLESLPQKAAELSSVVSELEMGALPHEACGEIHRRLHALYASALVFRMPALCAMLEYGIGLIDRMSLRAGDLSADAVAELERNLRQLARYDGAQEPDDAPAASEARAWPVTRALTHAPARGAATLPFVPAVSLPEARPAKSEPDGDKPLLTRSLRVLVLARSTRGALRDALEAAELAHEIVSDADALLASAREEAPDVVLADAELAHVAHLAAQLRGDPLTDYLPIVLVRESAHAPLTLDALRSHVDAVVTLPLDPADLARVLGRVSGALLDDGSALASTAPAALTLDELATRVAESVRRGILDAAEGAHGTAISAGDDAAVRAATLATVASVRAFVEQHSGGRVRFDERAVGGHPGLLQLQGSTRDDVDLNALAGRRILIADDDTGIVVLLAGLFRAHAATVVEVTGGDEALASARSERPDLVLTDIVMPGRDGIALCRALAADPLLADVPVLLIPAKEELLLCVRDGGASALRRDQLGRRVLAQAAQALAPRVALEEELRSGGEVRGALDTIGAVALLRSVRRMRPEARVTLRDAWNTFEILMSEGRIAQLTRTASDGSFVRGEAVLPQLVGITHGRFAVESAQISGKTALPGTIDEALTRAADELSSQLDAVQMPRLARVLRVTFDEDALSSLLRQGSPALARVIEALHQGASVAELPARTGVALGTIEALLVDLTRRGALRAVEAADGADVVEEARVARRSRPPSAHASPLSRIPPPPSPVISLLREPAPELEREQEALPERPVAAPEGGTPSSPLASVLPLDPPRPGRRAAAVIALVALAAVGFVVGREHRDRAALAAQASAPADDTLAATGAPLAPSAPATAPASAPSISPVPDVATPFISANEVGFRVVRGVPQGLKLSAQQGALVIESLPGVEVVSLRIDDRPVGPLPVTQALSDGVHELALEHGDAVSYRFVSVRPGHTYTLTTL